MKWTLLKVAIFCVLSCPQHKCDSRIPAAILDCEVPLTKEVTYKYLALVGSWKTGYLDSSSKPLHLLLSFPETSLGDSLYNSSASISLLFFFFLPEKDCRSLLYPG